MISIVWISIDSVKYGHLVITPKGGVVHSIMGPNDKDRRHPFFVGGLFNPRDDYAIHIFEDVSDVKFETWSPFESMEYFMHQLKIIGINLESVREHFITKSPFFNRTLVTIILLLVPLALWLSPSLRRSKFLFAWVLITFSVYSSGFILLIARSPRRFYALMLLFLLLAFHFMEGLNRALKERFPGIKEGVTVLLLFVLLAGAFALKPCLALARSARHILTVEQANPYKETAERIGAVDFPAPYAIIRSSQKPTTDYYMTYFLNKQLLGRPYSADVDGITEEMKAAGGRSLLVFDHPDMVEKLMGDERYVHLASIDLKNIPGADQAAGWVVTEHEIITGWDKRVDVFRLK